jgi:hypothetical protein
MLIFSLVEFAIAKTPMWQKHNIQLANFDRTSFRLFGTYLWVVGFRNGSIDFQTVTSAAPAANPRTTAGRYIKGAPIRIGAGFQLAMTRFDRS